MSEWYENMDVYVISQNIKLEITALSGSFVSIGFWLKEIKNRQLYKESGYENIWDFAKDNFGLSKSSASRFMAINDRFSLNGNSPILIEKYKDLQLSKLSEMLTLTDEQIGTITPDTTVKQIRDMKPKKEPKKKKENNLETSKESLSIYTECDAYSISKSCKNCYYDNTNNCPYDRTAMPPYKNTTALDTAHDNKNDSGCDGKCFYCDDETCNSHQEKREYCIYDHNTGCSLYGAHEVAISLGIDCKEFCCSRCKNDCEARCNHSAKEMYNNANNKGKEYVATSQQPADDNEHQINDIEFDRTKTIEFLAEQIIEDIEENDELNEKFPEQPNKLADIMYHSETYFTIGSKSLLASYEKTAIFVYNEDYCGDYSGDYSEDYLFKYDYTEWLQ